MSIDQILWILSRDFGFGVNHRLIIKLLSKGGSLTADDISKKAEIPKGRVYEYLNDLVDKKLILKNDDVPSKYFIESMETRLIDFSHKLLDDTVSKQKVLIDKIKDFENITPITNMHELNLYRSRERLLAKDLSYIMRDHTYPVFFYPYENEQEYLEFRTKFGRQKRDKEDYTILNKRDLIFTLRSNMKVISSSNYRIVLNKDSFDYYTEKIETKFGKEMLVERLSKILSFIKENKNVSVKLIEEPCSYNMMVTDHSLIFVMVEAMPLAEESFVNGFLLRGKNSVDKYLSIFNTRYNRGAPIETVIDKKLKELK